MPYILNYNSYDHDGYEVAGFPFTFREVGAYAFVHHFSSTLLLIDALIGLTIAILFGSGTVWLFNRTAIRGRGFPVVFPREK